MINYVDRNGYYISIANLLIQKYSLSGRVLDIGCSSGQLVRAFHDFGITAFGCDISQDVICKSPYALNDYLFNIDITKGKLPFIDGYFELIVLLDVIEHIPLNTMGIVLKEIRRILRTNGILYISTPNPLICKLLGYSDPTHISVKAKNFWILQLKNCGFNYLEDLPKKDLKIARSYLCINSRQKLLNTFYSFPFMPNLRSDLIFLNHSK